MFDSGRNEMFKEMTKHDTVENIDVVLEEILDEYGQ